ncbi:ABC transporter permease [Persicimonas caeni]|uniref:ABC transporter permease n=1 Tax=Persicimonas caeni TaxID=2292766 RepID=A0A4Y6PRL0_PERCE|nr:ABC transporter permease [Persicimonas caeni]QDG50958.1 ABC transporter permease [Persicimonas caeni]QED32179.1 ABC transporter permease [Persicimonas caeni]
MITKLAWRNLARNRWRSILTAAGVAVAVGLMVWTMAYMEGFFGAMVRGATALDTGQALIQRKAYVDEPSIYEAFALEEGMLEEVEQTEGVRAAAPRINLYGLIGNEQRSQVSKLLGVDAQAEAAATPITDAVVKGEWLSDDPEPPPAPREVVLGEGLARQLEVDLGAELVVFLEASDGSLGNDLLKVVGVVKTGNSMVDRQAAYVHLEDAQYVGALDGQVHEIVVKTDNPAEAEGVVAQMAPKIDAYDTDEHDLVVRSWQQARPQIAQMLELSDASNIAMFFILYLLASLGLLNTQRMSALERRREFGVMMAIGVTPRRLFMVILAETLLLSFVGALVGTALGGGLAWHHAVNGLDMTAFATNTDFTWMGISFSERLYFGLNAEIVLEPLLVMLGVAILCGLWPAAKAIGIDITSAIAGRN